MASDKSLNSPPGSIGNDSSFVRIREFDEVTDADYVRHCLVELQDFERRLDPRLPPGADIVDEYVPHMLDRCSRCEGKVLVAEVGNEVVGYVTILTRVQSEELEEGDLEYGLISDLVVLQRFRNRGLGKKLLAEAESYARECKVQWLRIGVLSDNQTATRLYSSSGFSGYYVEFEKNLSTTQSDT